MIKQKKGEIKKLFLMLISLLFVVVGSGLVSAEGIDEYTVLMLHMDGEGGGTTFTDDSDSSHTVYPQGDVHTNTIEKKFGTASAYFDGTGDFLNISNSVDWDFGTDDFTVDFWVSTTDTSTSNEWYRRLLSLGPYSNSSIDLMLNGNYVGDTDGGLTWWFESAAQLKTTITINDGNWHHVALSRSGDDLYIFIDGAEAASKSGISATDFTSSGLWVGTVDLEDRSFLNGYIDELRISKGIARWTENFDVPTSAYSEAGFGNLTTYWITPTTDTKVQQDEFFKVQIGVNCTGGDCGDVNVTLDPKEVQKAIEDYKMILDFIKEVFGR